MHRSTAQQEQAHLLTVAGPDPLAYARRRAILLARRTSGYRALGAVVLPYRPEAAGVARRLIRQKLTAWELPELVDPATLIISELVGNAVKTGCQAFMVVRVHRLQTSVRLAVRDGSRILPVLLAAGEDDECHRGLALVHMLTAGRWGVTPDSFGKTVYADLAYRPDSSTQGRIS
ncbi:ATP-binding protein [Kitasatospora sp. NPDC094028]